MKGIALKLMSLTLLAVLAFSAQASPFTIEVKRTSYNSSSLTGELSVNGKLIAHTLELPWNNNQSYISSIPSGTYDAILRYDKSDKWRLQLENVPNRTGIQIHMGNWPSQIQGCVLVGNKVKNGQNAVEDSGNAYSKLKNMFYGTSNPNMTPNVQVKVKISYHPARTSYSGKEFRMDYQDQGRWKVTSEGDSFSFKEVYRDMSYIYMSGNAGGERVYLRTPLMGGVMAQSESLNGPWMTDGAPTVTRSN